MSIQIPGPYAWYKSTLLNIVSLQLEKVDRQLGS